MLDVVLSGEGKSDLFQGLSEYEKDVRVMNIRDQAERTSQRFDVTKEERFTQLVSLNNAIHAHWPKAWERWQTYFQKTVTKACVSAATHMMKDTDITVDAICNLYQVVMKIVNNYPIHHHTRTCDAAVALLKGITQERIFEICKKK